jgi:metal-sulfur cluster biosynthetic enzyme
MTNSPDESSAPARPAPESSRPLLDRELPVSAVGGDSSPHGAASESVDPTPAQPEAETAAAATPDEGALSEDQVKIALRRVKDPELNLNILDLGLVYEIRVDGNAVAIDMTLTSPGCPSGPEIMTDAERHLKAIPGVGDVAVNLVWSPFWSPDRIEPRVRAYLGF